MIDLDEDGGSKLDRLGWVMVCIDGSGTAADVVIALVDGDIETIAGRLEVV